MKTKRYINAIDLLSSSCCNMNCSFCYLHKNNAYKILNDQVLKAYELNNYFDICKDVILKLNSEPKYIKNISFWGGETTLYLDKVGKNLNKLFENFPEVSTFFISSNMKSNANQLTAFVNAIIDQLPQEKDKFNLKIQASIDGPDGICTKVGHPGNFEDYTKSFIDFFDGVEKIHDKVKSKISFIQIKFNPTLPKDIYFDIFSDYNKAFNYFKYMFTYIKTLNSYISYLKNIIVVIPGTVGIALPFNDTTNDGYKYAECLKIINEVLNDSEIKKLYEYKDDFKYWRHYEGFNRDDSICAQNYECNQYAETLTILPDGTVVECNGTYIDSFDEYQKELLDKKEFKLLQQAQLSSKISYNPLKMTEYEIERINRIVVNGYRHTFYIYNALKYGLIKELALSHQIPIEYSFDKKLLIQHTQVLNQYYTCSRENMKANNIPYIGTPDQYRLTLNGAVQYAYQGKESYKREAFNNGNNYFSCTPRYTVDKRYN